MNPIPTRTCPKCQWTWTPRTETPKRCPRCGKWLEAWPGMPRKAPSVALGAMFLAAGLMMSSCRNRPLNINLSNPTQASYRNPDDYFFIGAGQSNMEHENLSLTFAHTANVAVGGTPLAAWTPGTPAYASILAACQAQSRPCVLLFWQGETNGITADGYPWAQVFVQTMTRLRADLNTEIPIIYVQIGQMPAPEYSCWIDIQNQQASVQDALPKMAMVSAKDMFPDTGDGIHYGADQYAVMQKRMFQAWETL